MNFSNYAKIWDLHIHTNKCPKGTSDFVKLFSDNTEGYVDQLIGILTNDHNQKVEMISFTDHNQISLEVYKSFYKRQVDIVLIPGVEIDCLTSEINQEPKHIIVYFECDESNIEHLAVYINNLLRETRESAKFLEIKVLLEGLIKSKFNFIISPHAFKQGKRGIDFDWNGECSTEIEAQMYMDQFFAFWESSGHSSIQKAKELLCDFELNEKISLVTFSDSNNFCNLKKYVDKPPQFFNSLSSFRGLAMIGSDATRIRNKRVPFDESRNPGMIKEVIFDGKSICFSQQLNAIIGGRGSGKSLLLDAMAHKLNEASLEKKRKDYIEKFPIIIKNFNDKEINASFSVDYYSQAYVNHLFSDDNFSTKLKEKFSDSFSSLTSINEQFIKTQNKNEFLSLVSKKGDITLENLDSFSNHYPIISNDGLDIKIQKKDKVSINKSNKLLDYLVESKRIDDFINNIPDQIKGSSKIVLLKQIIKSEIFAEIHNYNTGYFKTSYSINKFIDSFFEEKSNKTTIATKKSEIEDMFKKNVDSLTEEIIYRNSLINTYFIISKGFKKFYSEYKVESGAEEDRFIFSNELNIETPFDYLIKIFNSQLDMRSNDVNHKSLPSVCQDYIKGLNHYKFKERFTIETITKELEKYDLTYRFQNNIYYSDNGEIKNILNQSPGTQTNILMEYIVYKKTSKPLLIDQPEDNIDNKTIYEKLRKWFSKLKNERQVIVVTHDANIVINADAENVVVAEQLLTNDFTYKHGALEFENIIEDASSILDGGKNAVKRRLTKYES